jgi:putative tricarboxylic transport membrane protein
MMEGLLAGFASVLQPQNLLFSLLGAFIGTMIGVLPGIGPTAAIAMLLPLTLGLDPVTAIIMIAGIYYGTCYGGSTTAILVNIPGEAQSVVTCIDGYQMARNGRAGVAIGMAAIASFIAGTLGAVAIGLVSVPLINFAIRFGPPEFFILMALGFAVLLVLSKASPVKSGIMICAGLALSFVGQDAVTGVPRFTFGMPELLDGISVVTVAMGLFGLGEVLHNLERLQAILRGSGLGFLIGLLPGGGATLASFISYAVEKHVAKDPSRFGKGAIEGVAGPEAANNAGAAGAFIPLLTLGLPGNPVTAILLSALVLHGVAPGPLMIEKNPQIFWGVVASMYVGNVMLLVLNLPLVGVWVQLLRVPYRVLFPSLILFMLIGAYSINNNLFDVVMLLVFGVAGYVLRKLEFDTAPLILAFVLGQPIELALRQSLMMSRGAPEFLLTRPIALGVLAAIVVVIALPMLKPARRIIVQARAASDD